MAAEPSAPPYDSMAGGPPALPEELSCPITGEPFYDPVLCVGDGQTYERAAIKQWFDSGKRTSPLTGGALKDISLVPNHTVRSMLAAQGSAVSPAPHSAADAGSSGAGPSGKAPAEKKQAPAAPPDPDLLSWLRNYSVGSEGPRPDQLKAYAWFDSNSGWQAQYPLHRAAMQGNVAEIARLCDSGRNPNEKMSAWYDSEPLGWAASLGHLRAVIALMEHGADPLRPKNKAGFTTMGDAVRERHTHVINFLREHAARKGGVGFRPGAQVMSRDLIPERNLSAYEENYGLVFCPVFGHPDFDKGAYHSPIGLCCATMKREHNARPGFGSVLLDAVVGMVAMSYVVPIYVATLCYQPCGPQFPWLGDCPLTSQRVTRAYVCHAPSLLTYGPARERRDAGLPV